MYSRLTAYYVCYFVFLLLFIWGFSGYSQDSTIIKEEDKGFDIGFSNQLVTKYFPRVGIHIGEGFANQNLAYVSHSGIKIFGFTNFGLPDNRMTGILYGIQYTIKLPITIKKTGFHNTFAINKYIFPAAEMNNWVADNFFIIKGRIQTTIQYSHVFEAGKVKNGDRIFVIMKLPLNYQFLKFQSLITPSISSAYHDNFYGKTGFAHFTIGLNNKVIFKRLFISAFVNYQHSFNSIQKYQESGFYGGLGITFYGKI